MMIPTAMTQQLHRRMQHVIQKSMPRAKLMKMAMAQILTLLAVSSGLQLGSAAASPTGAPSPSPSAPTPSPSAPTPGSALSLTYYDGLCTSIGTLKFIAITDAVVAPRIAADPGLAPALMRYTTPLILHSIYSALFSLGESVLTNGNLFRETHRYCYVCWLDLESL